jgi:23S rRNA (adenine2503-C2)-methyltransferase
MTTTPLPHPLSLTADAFAQSARGAFLGGLHRAREAYCTLYRTGRWPAWLADAVGTQQAGAWDVDNLVGPVVRLHASESDEGTVLKFTQQVSRGAPGAAARRWTPDAPALGDPQSTAADGALETESVLIPMIGKRRHRAYTLCVSSQVGCAMGCTFCQTAQMGLVRSLSPQEIVGQWFCARWRVQRPDPDASVRNMVFMGMGEPLDNLDAVLRAIEVLTDRAGANMAMSRVTVSTVGRLDGIARLAQKVHEHGWHRLGLAVSVNAPSDSVRSAIMPINKSAPMDQLRSAIASFPRWGTGHLMLEYVLIPGVNDSDEHAQQLATWVRGDASQGQAPLAACVNVIPYNPREGSPWGAPAEPDVDRFVAHLTELGLYVKRRRTKGRDQMAACGQLGNLAFKRARAGHTGLTVHGRTAHAPHAHRAHDGETHG